MAQTVKGLSTVQETLVQSLGQEDPLEKEMVTHSLKNLKGGGACWAPVHGVAELGTTQRLKLSLAQQRRINAQDKKKHKVVYQTTVSRVP